MYLLEIYLSDSTSKWCSLGILIRNLQKQNKGNTSLPFLPTRHLMALGVACTRQHIQEGLWTETYKLQNCTSLFVLEKNTHLVMKAFIRCLL